MKGFLALVLLAAVGTIHGRKIGGRINERTNWLTGNLSVRPAMTASIEYHIRYPKGGPQPIIAFYYDGQDSPNLQQRCNAEMHGQLYNKDLAVPLNGYYRKNQRCNKVGCTKKCSWGCTTTCTTWKCEGSIKIQDFEPKSYFFSLGFECDETEESLSGLSYDITIYDESNKTSCVDLNMTQGQRINRCERSYQFAAIPNQLGDITLNGAVSRMSTYLRRSPSELPSKECLAKLESFICEIFLPKCLPEENRIIMPCRDDCKFYLEGCLNFGRGAFVNCDYLPPCEGKNTVTGAIEEDTSWFLSNLSVCPAMSVSIEYHIQYQCPSCVYGGRPRNLPIITFYYNGQDSPNIQGRCNAEMHGQLYNEDLAVPLRGRYREKFWCNYRYGGIRKCYGRTQIRDFEPKLYFFSLGFECNEAKGNLKGLKYEVTIYDESNETSCVDLNSTSEFLINQCQRSYHYAAIPNQFGDTDLDGAMTRMKRFSDADLPSTQCLDKLDSFLCKIFLPKCLPEENRIIPPCREDCQFYLQGCLGKVMNCDYLPPCEGKNTVTGAIEEDTTWFLSNLSVRPARTASIEYHIQYQYQDYQYHRYYEGRYEVFENPPIITFYYNGQDSPNLRHKCNSEMHGQLFNKDLAVPLSGKHREKFWCNHKGGMKVCHGRTKIQDFEPKSYFFSLGIECNTTKNLKDLKYEVTIYDESNRTSCVDLNKVDAERIHRCDRSYQYAAIPNQVGDTDLDAAVSNMNRFLDAAGFAQLASKFLKAQNKGCLKSLKPFLCQIFLPQCLPKENKILLPCRDSCKSLLEDCTPVDLYTDFSAIDAYCDYLPPCPSNGGVSVIIGLSVCACVIVVVMAVCVKYRKTIRNNWSKL